MLEAVSVMLVGEQSIKVKCAKTILDKIIEGMDTGIPDVIVEDKIEKIKEKALAPKNEVSMEVDDKRKIVKVHNATPDTIIELDGKKYAPAQVIGMTFTKGKIL